MAELVCPDHAALTQRIAALEADLRELREGVRASHVFGAGSAALDAARARKLHAEAEAIEREVANEYGLTPDDGVSPVLARTWTIERSQLGAGAPVVILRLIGEGGRVHQVELTPDLAASLSGGLGSMVADILADARQR